MKKMSNVTRSMFDKVTQKYLKNITRKYVTAITLNNFRELKRNGITKDYVTPDRSGKINHEKTNQVIRNLEVTIKKRIEVIIDLFRGKERICWTCGHIRLICIILNFEGNFIKYSEGCACKIG